MVTLPEILASEDRNIDEIAEYLTNLFRQAANRVNTRFSPERLVKQPRDIEPLPEDRRQLSSYRTRIGTMLEYALSTEAVHLLKERYGDQYFLTFAVAHEYPDFYFRDQALSILLRIEMKAVDADSDEQAARFSTPTAQIDSEEDLLLLIGWEWQDLIRSERIIGEYPHIFACYVIPAGEIARERDIRLEKTGGKIVGNQVYVLSSRTGNYVPDPGNYGKLWRIIDKSRRRSEVLSKSMKDFLQFLKAIDDRSNRSRL